MKKEVVEIDVQGKSIDKVDQGTVAMESEGKKRYKWEELPFVSRGSLWDPAKKISAKSDFAKEMIGEEFALSYLKLMKEEGIQVGLASLFFIARDMAKGAHLNNCAGIERAFFDMIDSILRQYCLNFILMDNLKERNRSQIISLLAHGDYPKTWQLEAIKTMGTLDKLLWKKRNP